MSADPNRSTDRYPAASVPPRHDTAMHTAKAATAGLVVRLGAHRWAIPTAGLMTLLGSLIMGVWSIASARVEAYEAKVQEIEQTLVEADRVSRQQSAEYDLRFQRLSAANQTNEAMLFEIRSQLQRIDARVAEVQVTLMRRGQP